jgi:hypothetical protein
MIGRIFKRRLLLTKSTFIPEQKNENNTVEPARDRAVCG